MAAVHARVFVNCDDFYGDAHSTAHGLMGTDCGERDIMYVVGWRSSVRTLNTRLSCKFNVYRNSRDVFHGRASATVRRTEIGTFRRNDIGPLSVGPRVGMTASQAVSTAREPLAELSGHARASVK